ncbi:hypothetical protein PTKIN_Ptkin12aG0039700 [Pterospermum kingtungense]
MVLRFISSVLLFCLLLLRCDNGIAAKDLKDKHSTTAFHKDCDEANEKISSQSSYITRLESKYKPDYGVIQDDEKSSSSSSYISRLESKYKPGYIVDDAEKKSSYIAGLESKYKPDYGVIADDEKSSSSSSYISRLESKYNPGYIADDAEKKSSYIVVLESKYKPDYGVIADDEKSSSSSSYISRLESKYNPGYIADDAEKKSSYIAGLESKYKPDYGAIADDKKSSSSSSYISRLESKYNPGYIADDTEKKSSYIAGLESKYKPDYGVIADDEKSSSSSSYISRLESKYSPGYIADDAEKKGSYIADLESKYKPGLESKYKPSYTAVEDDFPKDVNGVEEKKSPQSSSKMMEHHHIENHGEDDGIGSEDVGVFTIDDVLGFDVGRRLSTFFSIRNHSLYPDYFLPREVADSIPFSSSETLKILQFFSVSSDSPKGRAIKDTLRRCEIKAAKGETKICATSSESMHEFLRNAFGPEANFKLITTSHPAMTTPTLQSYTVLGAPREIESPKKVACHPLPYLYAIYMCHFDVTETRIYKVPLVGDNGDKVDALIVCHMDTSAWSPKHTAFSLLGTKPGIPVCHAFTDGHGVWIQSSSPVAAM